MHVHLEPLRLERLGEHRVGAAVLGADLERREAAVARIREAPVLEVERCDAHAGVGPSGMGGRHPRVAGTRARAVSGGQRPIGGREQPSAA